MSCSNNEQFTAFSREKQLRSLHGDKKHGAKNIKKAHMSNGRWRNTQTLLVKKLTAVLCDTISQTLRNTHVVRTGLPQSVEDSDQADLQLRNGVVTPVGKQQLTHSIPQVEVAGSQIRRAWRPPMGESLGDDSALKHVVQQSLGRDGCVSRL